LVVFLFLAVSLLLLHKPFVNFSCIHAATVLYGGLCFLIKCKELDVKWFEDFGVGMVRGTNIFVFLAIVLSGVLFAIGSDSGAPFQLFVIIGAFMVAGLVTGVISMACQVHEHQTRQTALLEELLKEMKTKG